MLFQLFIIFSSLYQEELRQVIYWLPVKINYHYTLSHIVKELIGNIAWVQELPLQGYVILFFLFDSSMKMYNMVVIIIIYKLK